MSKTIQLPETRSAYNLEFESQALNQGPIFVEQHGKLVAVIISPEEYQRRVTQDADTWRHAQLQRLEPNLAAYQQLLPQLLKTHLHQWVAIHKQELVDADTDRAALVERVRANGYRQFFIEQVTAEPRFIELPSPEEVERV